MRSLIGNLFMMIEVDDITASFAILSAFSFPGIPMWDGTQIYLIMFFDVEIRLVSW
jgi:hypothetical protein